MFENKEIKQKAVFLLFSVFYLIMLYVTLGNQAVPLFPESLVIFT